MTSFREYHLTRTNAIGYTTEDVLVSFLPLARQVSETHQRGSVAPLQGVSELRVREGAIWFEDGKSRPVQSNLTDVAPLLEEMRRGAAEVVAEHRREFEIGDRAESITDLQVAAETGPIDGPVYLPNYESWEHAFDHHDPLTDIYSLGMILASMACGLDFHDPSDLETFVRNRRNLFQVRRDLHPVIARAVLQMTDLDRAARPADLQALLQSLHNFGEQPVELQFELDRIEGFHTKDLQTKQQLVLAKLQERLFEISRRNRLLHFRSTMQTLNLTEASVPLSFDYKNVREDQLLTWNAKFSKACVAGQSISLHKYLNFQEALYLPMVLDRIRTEARRDQAEFGFAQLRLVICFLRWSNLKEEPPELFHSPLVLLPVELTKKKGVRDSYLLRVLDTQAEVNPVLRHQFKQLYNVELPETIDLEESNLQTFYEYLQAQIGASESAVELTLVEKPRISLLHDKARRRLDQYRRRARLSGRGVRNYLELDYSYDPANYHPMGLTLFSTKIRQPETQLRAILEKRPRPKSYMSNPADGPADAVESEKTFFTLKRAADDNPYNWEFDLCSVTLGNFKYRKMSLVRDYAAMVDREIENQAFDDIFSLTPRPVADADQSLPDLVDRFHVVPCDPTQTASIAGASNGESYIIQGPPGTGKSQTITNLIADYVARGKRVLFVCEKRAAIDVVYLRLKQQGLHELCCLIHDSQADKKQFVMDLKETYESFLSGDWGNGDGQSELTSRLDAELEPLVDYRSAMLESSDPDGPALRDVVDRAVELAPRRPDATALEIERAPRYECWRIHAGELARFRAALEDIQADGVLANHPLALLSPKICDAERPLELITTSLASARSALDDLEEEFGRCHVIRETWSTVKRAEQLVEFARVLAPLARCRGLTLLDGNSALSAKYGVARNQLDELRTAWVRAGEKNAHWREKLPKLETPIALRQARRLDGKWWAALSPTWWRLRSVMNRCYNYAEHAIRPSWVDVLQNLQAEQDAEQRWADDAAKMQSSFGFEQDVDDFAEEVARAIQQVESCEGPLGALRQEVSRGNVDPAVVLSLVGHAATVERLNSILAAFLDDYQERTWDQLRADFSRVERALEQLDNFLFCLTELSPLPREMASAIRQLPYDLEELESLSADQFIADAARRDRRVGRFNGLERDRRASRLEQFYDDWLGGNAVEVRARVRAAFRERVRVCGLPAAQLSDDQKEFKKFYNRGRRELEHEFSKTMRYKSIRGLVSGDSGEVVKDLKPVWLMSPLSVSDTVPLAGSHFDVVIFDEASQITLEEAVPTIFRAPQAIVVGDEMQLPPTDFFSARRNDDDEVSFFDDEAGEQVQYDLESNSLLNHAARNLSSTMLGWHYRSRSESLISFSNWAFYGGNLLTIPEEELPVEGRRALTIEAAEDAAKTAADVLRRPVSFHFLEQGVYEKRRNRAEATYIAHLVRAILQEEDHYSIGVVAFSEAQQGEIEDALNRLAQADDEFAGRLEQEYEREDDGEFAGLLVKNLENIQGDERDLIIMSVCYGHDSEGKMRMNFGPINKSGGEKRLNVAFSRARHRMVLVSSIRATDITNDYNDGANCLKRYLQYADATSLGDLDAAQRVLHEMSPAHTERDDTGQPELDAVTKSIGEELRNHGWTVDYHVGQSQFRCDLAMRAQGDSEYRLGVLVDSRNYYAAEDSLEREMMKPLLLRRFGWRVEVVLGKDWHGDREAVLERLLSALNADGGE